MNLDNKKRKQATFVWIWIALGLIGLGLLCFVFSPISGIIPASGDGISHAAIFKSFGAIFSGGAAESVSLAIIGVGLGISVIICITALVFAIVKRVSSAIVGSIVVLCSTLLLAFAGCALRIVHQSSGNNGTAIILIIGEIALFFLAILAGSIAVLVGFIFGKFSELEVQPDPEEEEEAIEEPASAEEREDENELNFASEEDEEEFDVNEERLRQIIREELAALKMSPTNIYVTVPPEGAEKPAAKPAAAPAPAPVEPAKKEEAPVVAAAPAPEPVKKEPAPVVEEKKPEPAPVVEEPVAEETPAEEVEEAEEAPAEAGNSLGFPISENKRKVPFEEKLANADKELVEKYEGLRDYIMSYGIKNRVSIPGDTFSAHRERYVFITITGKKLKVNFALDPKDYENGPIPVTANPSKKYEDIPLTFKIKSDLSYRRALKLVDDVMAKKGVSKAEN